MEFADAGRRENNKDFGHLLTKARFFNKAFGNKYKTFATKTSMHGFSEIYHASSIFYKCFWVLILVVASGFTLYQVYQAADQYINQTTTTTIEAVNEDEILYPPMELCVNHWIQWVDWNKALELNYSRDAVVYAFSYPNFTFDNDRAADDFDRAQNLNNISTREEFGKLVAKKVDFFIKYVYDSETGGGGFSASELFTEFELDPYENQVCYKASSENVKTVRNKNQFKSLRETSFNLWLDQEAMLEDPLTHLSAQEYARYISSWLLRRQYQMKADIVKLASGDYFQINEVKDAKKYSHFSIPLSFYVNSYSPSSITLLQSVDTYTVTVKAVVNRWKKSVNKPCVEGEKFILSNTTCFDNCYAKKRNEKTLIVETIEETNGQDSDVFVPSGTNNTTEGTNNNSVGATSASNHVNRRSRSRRSIDKSAEEMLTDPKTQFHKECKQQCSRFEGCETWRYDVTVTSSMFHGAVEDFVEKVIWSSVIIKLPSEGETFVVIETDKQSWDNFVGSIGGIVGVWTGASILSLIQLFYLCLCANPLQHLEDK